MNGVSAEQAQALYNMTDDELRAYTAGLDQAQLDEVYAALDGVDVEAQTKTVDLEAAAAWYREALGWPIRTDGERLLTTVGPDGCGYDVLEVTGPAGMFSLADIKHRACPPGCTDTAFCKARGPLEQAAGIAITSTAGRLIFLPCAGGQDGTPVKPGITLRTAGEVEVPPSRTDGIRASWIVWPTPATPDAA